jgi:hypothetical protein
VIDPAQLWARLPLEMKLAVLQHWDGVVSADLAADVTRAGDLSYTRWLGDPPLPAPDKLVLPATFVTYIHGLLTEEP